MIKKMLTAMLPFTLLVMTSVSGAAVEPAENPGFKYHRFLKHYMYATLTYESSQDVLMGTQQPFLQFAVLEDPPSVFINFEIAPDKVDSLVEFLDFPEGFALTPISILEGEPPRLYLTVNIYAVYGLRGLLTGNRAEWSVYVTKDGGRPSYMVVDAKASELTLDSVNGFTRGTELHHARSQDGIRSAVASDGGTSFRSLVTRAGMEHGRRLPTETAWVSANDRIYWRDGVSDRTYYDGDFVDTPVLSVDPRTLFFEDDTVWSQFVHPRPVNVLVYENGFELVISPWYNLDPE